MEPDLQLKNGSELNLDINAESNSEQLKSKLDEQSDVLVEELFQVDTRDLKLQQQKAIAVRDIGIGVQRDLVKRSNLLRQPLSKLVSDAEDGGTVSNSLIALQEQTDKINPNKFDFTMSTVRRLIAKIPGVGTPLSRWFAKYQSIDSVIQNIVSNLQEGQAQLKRDNVTLKEDQIAMRNLIFQLRDYVEFGILVDKKISTRLETSTDLEAGKRKFIEEEILFPLKQRVLDLQQQLAVNQQGILTTDVIISNNSELIRGVSRALNVTITALNIAASLAVALQTQKTILKSVQAVNSTTDKLISQTSESLKTQGAEIHKQASSAQLDIENLKQAFNNVTHALNDISKFRREALPRMSESISEMEVLTKQMDKAVSSLEQNDVANTEVLLNLT